jgi:hypothetical protein
MSSEQFGHRAYETKVVLCPCRLMLLRFPFQVHLRPPGTLGKGLLPGGVQWGCVKGHTDLWQKDLSMVYR